MLIFICKEEFYVKRIKNADTVEHTWVGQTILAGEYYTIDSTERSAWSSNSALLIAIANGTAIVNDGTSDITNLSTAIDCLKGNTISAAITSQPQVIISTTPAYGSKTITVSGVSKKLYVRNVGLQATLATGVNTINYTASLTWSKLLGIEIVSCEPLDRVDFQIYDTATGNYSGYPNTLLDQFGYAVNLPKDYYIKTLNLNIDLYAGLVVRFTYTSISAKTIGINLLLNEVES